MRNKRKLLLFALSVSIVAAFGTSSASAQSLVDEGTGSPCSAISEGAGGVSGGCPVAGISNDFELGGIFGVMNVCDIALEGTANASGEMIGDYDFLNCEAGSSRECTGNDYMHSRAEVTSGSGSVATLETHFCVVTFGLTVRCHIRATGSEIGAHDYVMSFTHVNKCENEPSLSLQGTISCEIDQAHPELEAVE